MLRHALVVYRKEMLAMRRDRRLSIGVTVTSLVVMPALMGFLGQMTNGGNGGPELTPVMLATDHPAAVAVVQGDPTLWAIGATTDSSQYPDHVTITSDDETIRVVSDRTKSRLWAVAERIDASLEIWKRDRVVTRLQELGISRSELDPFTVQLQDRSSETARGAVLLGTLMPYLVIVLLVANSVRAVYVAVGEKEKNTLASVLVSQVPREAIVIGKSLAITTFAIFASVLLITGMVLFANLGFTIAGDSLGGANFQLRAAQIVELAVNISGLALVISAVIMVVGTYARTQREAGVYTAPLLFISIFLAVFSFSDTPFSTAVYAIPILGNALTMKATIVDGTGAPELGLVLAVNALVFAVLVWVSVAMYRRETVLFRR